MAKIMLYKKMLLFLVSFSLTGCGILPHVYYDSSSSAYAVAEHNYEILLAAKKQKEDYLLVTPSGVTTPKELFLYINSLREPLQKYSIMTDAMIKYNKAIIDKINNN